MSAPPVIALPDWEERTLPFKIGSGRTLASQAPVSNGDPGEARIRLRVFFRKGDGHLIGRVWFGDGAEGPPGHVHGGASAYILDEAMGSMGWMHHIPVMAAHLDFDYHLPTPLYHDLTVEAWIDEPKGRRLTIHSRLTFGEQVYVSGRGEFAIVPRSKIALLADANDPRMQALTQDPRIRWAAE